MARMSSDSSYERIPIDEEFELVLGASGPHAVLKNGHVFGGPASRSLTNYSALLKQENASGYLKAKVLVTGACNQRCYFCSVAADWDKGGLTTPELIRVFQGLRNGGILHVQLHGGDVSVRRDLPGLLGELDALGLSVDFFTNGSGPAWDDYRTYEVLAGMSPRPTCTISLLAATSEAHDKLAGVRGVFEKAQRTIRRLLDAGARVELTASLSRESMTEMAGIRALADSYGAPFQIIADVYSSVDGIIDNRSLELFPDEIVEARAQSLGDQVVELSRIDCAAGLTSLTIDHEGYLVGCDQNSRRRFGSLLESSLVDLVGHSDYQDYVTSQYRRPIECADCPDELASYCSWCPATPMNYGIPKDQWVDWHCKAAMKRRLFWSGKSDAIPGVRPAAQLDSATTYFGSASESTSRST
ncbi:MAG: radical SAM protein [bacterium]|nr:radical SAM protein [bacterium]